MELRVGVRAWAAWAPGLAEPAAWRAWAQAPWLPAGDAAPALPEVPAMVRRRLSRLGRAVVHVANEVGAGRRDLPLVHASRYGELERSLGAIEATAAGEPLSPTVFASSVHNGIGAMHSIIGGHTGNMICVAAGPASAAVGCVEALALLADGADEVVLTCYDEALPPLYANFADAPPAWFAWAWRLGAADGGDALTLTRCDAPAADNGDAALPDGLELLRWWLGDTPAWTQRDAALGWRWSRDV